MKKTLTKGSIFLMMVAVCGEIIINNCVAQTHTIKRTTVVKKKITTTTAKPTAADLAAGKDLISKSDCLTCHKIDAKVIGPAYKDVAAKYPATQANYAALTQKVISGGSGNWGTIPMAPHPNLAPADVKKMVEYILSIK